jgi:hypothetical protein
VRVRIADAGLVARRGSDERLGAGSLSATRPNRAIPALMGVFPDPFPASRYALRKRREPPGPSHPNKLPTTRTCHGQSLNGSPAWTPPRGAATRKPQDAVDGLPREPESSGRTVHKIPEVAFTCLAHGMASDDHASPDAEGVCRDGILRAHVVLIP